MWLELKDIDLQTTTPEEIGQILIDAKKAYYTSGKPVMSDHTYDTLEAILRQKNPHHRLFQKVGNANFDTGFAKKHHIMPMGSQNKVTSFPDLVHYFELKKISTDTVFVIQPKCDGISLEIIYKNGQLVQAITRGDGQIGDVITQNVVKMQNFVMGLPNHLSCSVRCEIVVTQKDFQNLNQISDEKYSNPRNAASGLSQRLDSKYSEFCSLFAVDMFPNLATINDEINYLKSYGFTTIDSHICNNFDAIEKIYQKFLEKDRLTYPFDIDGLVVKINDLKLAQTLGSQNNRPKFQVAYKFPASTNQTQLLEVNWQTGPMGTITPVAKIEPVEISGAIISYVSLANFDLVKDLNLNLGDIVEVSRRGDVIPHIDKVVNKIKPGHLEAPKLCPTCHSLLITDHKFIKCPNKFGCPAQTLGLLRLFCQTLEIKGISDKTIEKLATAGKIQLPGDLYDLKIGDFIDLTGLGQKSGANIINQIQAKKILSVVEIFDSAIIPNFSAKRIKEVVNAGFDTPEKLEKLNLSDLIQIPGFKSTLAQKIIDGLNQRQPVIKSILDKVEIKNLKFKISNLKLVNKTFVITGDLSVPRKNIEKLIEDNGGQVLSAVSQNTSYLITNSPSNSSKYLTAQKLNVKIITEAEFSKLLNKNGNF
ncbi:MAG: NAD-dependent DNA ligase LigA [Candidatus Shapirobacteria bacterium]|jgi:DNA ligase (NAD+)